MEKMLPRGSLTGLDSPKAFREPNEEPYLLDAYRNLWMMWRKVPTWNDVRATFEAFLHDRYKGRMEKEGWDAIEKEWTSVVLVEVPTY